jgi:hypothetical protein
MRLPTLLLAVLALATVVAAQTTASSITRDANTSPQTQQTTFDRHIYVPVDGSANVCAKIKSFNFTTGPNPKLKSITTCTPLNARSQKRAQDETPTPHPEFRLVESAQEPR